MASRRKLRFTTKKGQLATEDLWGLSIESLDLIGKRVKADIRDMNDGMVKPADKLIIENDLRLLLIQYVIKDKQDKRGVPLKLPDDVPEEIL